METEIKENETVIEPVESVNEEPKACEKKKCCCKCLPYVLMGVLAIAIIVLYVLFFLSKDAKPAAEVVIPTEDKLPIAYITMDSVLTKYTFIVEGGDALQREQESMTLKLNQKKSALESEMADFQNKLQNNVYATEERAQSEYQRISKKGQDLEIEANKISQELMAKQQKLMETAVARIDSVVDEYNATKGYHFIFINTNRDNIVYGNPGYDITDDIIEMLNK